MHSYTLPGVGRRQQRICTPAWSHGGFVWCFVTVGLWQYKNPSFLRFECRLFMTNMEYWAEVHHGHLKMYYWIMYIQRRLDKLSKCESARSIYSPQHSAVWPSSPLPMVYRAFFMSTQSIFVRPDPILLSQLLPEPWPCLLLRSCFFHLVYKTGEQLDKANWCPYSVLGWSVNIQKCIV